MNDLIVLQHGRTRVTVAPQYGGRIAQLELFDGRAWLELLHDDSGTQINDRDPLAWGCYPMAPWPNRIAGGSFDFDGRTYSLPTNRDGHALHGLALDRPWEIVELHKNAVVMQLSLTGSAWPWRAACTQSIAVLDDGIRLELAVSSMDESPFPAGVGWHPWFRRDVRPGNDDVRLLVDADQVYELESMIPTGRLIPVDVDHDLRGYPQVEERRIDACYWHPRGNMRIRWNDVELTMRHSPNVAHAVVSTPAYAVCIEPQTCAIDAFNLDARGLGGNGVAVLSPGESLAAWSAWHWTND